MTGNPLSWAVSIGLILGAAAACASQSLAHDGGLAGLTRAEQGDEEMGRLREPLDECVDL